MHFLIPEEIAFRIANIQHGTVIHSLAVLANISNVLVKSGALFSYTFCHVFKVPEKHINYSAVFHINLQRHPLSNLCWIFAIFSTLSLCSDSHGLRRNTGPEEYHHHNCNFLVWTTLQVARGTMTNLAKLWCEMPTFQRLKKATSKEKYCTSVTWQPQFLEGRLEIVSRSQIHYRWSFPTKQPSWLACQWLAFNASSSSQMHWIRPWPDDIGNWKWINR